MISHGKKVWYETSWPTSKAVQSLLSVGAEVREIRPALAMYFNSPLLSSLPNLFTAVFLVTSWRSSQDSLRQPSWYPGTPIPYCQFTSQMRIIAPMPRVPPQLAAPPTRPLIPPQAARTLQHPRVTVHLELHLTSPLLTTLPS